MSECGNHYGEIEGLSGREMVSPDLQICREFQMKLVSNAVGSLSQTIHHTEDD